MYRNRKPSASTNPSRNVAPGVSIPAWSAAGVTAVGLSGSNVTDAREHLRAEQLQRPHERIEIRRTGRVQGQVEHAGSDLRATALHLLDDRVRAPDERGGQRAAHDRRPRLAGDVARIQLR